MEFATARAGKALRGMLVALTAIGFAAAAQAQTITSAPSTASQGSSVTITGSGFGTKASAAPVIYDDFENGTAGSVISTERGWTEVGLGGTQQPRYDSALRHAGNNSMKLFWNSGQYSSSVKKRADFREEFYLDGWFQYDQEDNAPWSRVVKLMVLFGNSGIEYPQIHVGTSNCVQDATFHVAGYANANTASDSKYVFSLLDLVGSFHHIQIWIKASDSDVANGAIRVWFDGQLIASSDSYLTVAGNEGLWDHVRLGYYHAHDGIPGMCDASPGDAFGYWDNVYIDNSRARVELGDNPVYENCGVRETQVPTSWTSDAITVDFKQGNFQPGDPAWLFVVNPDGSRSAGRQITIGGEVTGGPGTPGQPFPIN